MVESSAVQSSRSIRHVAIVFTLAVFLPSLILAWLALRSLRDQQFVLEHQQALLYQGTADNLAEKVRVFMNDRQREFEQLVEQILADQNPRQIAPLFDEKLRAAWSIADVGFSVTLDGAILSPTTWGNADGARWRRDNELFFSNRMTAEVYSSKQENWITKNDQEDKEQDRSLSLNSEQAPSSHIAGAARGEIENQKAPAADEVHEKVQTAAKPQAAPSPAAPPAAKSKESAGEEVATAEEKNAPLEQRTDSKNLSEAKTSSLDRLGFYSKKAVARSVIPQRTLKDDVVELGKTTSSEAEFRQVIAGGNSGSLARFVDNKLRIMVWYRSPRDPQLVFGAQLNLDNLKKQLTPLVALDYHLGSDVCAALIDDTSKPVAQSHPEFSTNWRHPFVASEIGELLPHWEAGIYLLHPDQLNHTARVLTLTFSLLIAGLVSAIGIGGWLMVADLRRQSALARQKTDFVSNVSHELKTPLTSIRMFAELLTEGRVDSREKQSSYLKIISAEAARLTRLINNVLDFAKMERGEKKYHLEPCDLSTTVNEVVQNYRPHLEANGFHLQTRIAEHLPTIPCDRDALSQVLVNLISNAEKYGGEKKEIEIEAVQANESVEIRMMDRGPGVPAGTEDKIFEQFYRAHDSLGSGIQGSGLGLTLARQIARAHGGDVTYMPRVGGGSCFILKLKS